MGIIGLLSFSVFIVYIKINADPKFEKGKLNTLEITRIYDKDGFELMIPIIAIMKNDLINAINIVEKRNYLGSSDIKWKELKKWINDREEEFFNYHTIFDEIKDWLYSNHSNPHIFIEKFYKGYCNSLRNICRGKKKQFVDYKTDIF